MTAPLSMSTALMVATLVPFSTRVALAVAPPPLLTMVGASLAPVMVTVTVTGLVSRVMLAAP